MGECSNQTLFVLQIDVDCEYRIRAISLDAFEFVDTSERCQTAIRLEAKINGGYYQISDLGRAYLVGDIDADRLERD
ncbi:hypothetical protein GCM10028857_20710 [Salinarchaeum chitinilyticum]